MTFGARLKELRKMAGLTQSDLASKLSLSKANISKYESEEIQPSLQTLVKLSDIFETSTDYLLGNTDFSDAVNHLFCLNFSKLLKNNKSLFEIIPSAVMEKIRNKDFKFSIDFLSTIAHHLNLRTAELALILKEEPEDKPTSSIGHTQPQTLPFLSSAEQHLIEAYRKLTDEGKSLLISYTDFLIEKHSDTASRIYSLVAEEKISSTPIVEDDIKHT